MIDLLRTHEMYAFATHIRTVSDLEYCRVFPSDIGSERRDSYQTRLKTCTLTFSYECISQLSTDFWWGNHQWCAVSKRNGPRFTNLWGFNSRFPSKYTTLGKHIADASNRLVDQRERPYHITRGLELIEQAFPCASNLFRCPFKFLNSFIWYKFYIFSWTLLHRELDLWITDNWIR